MWKYSWKTSGVYKEKNGGSSDKSKKKKKRINKVVVINVYLALFRKSFKRLKAVI